MILRFAGSNILKQVCTVKDAGYRYGVLRHGTSNTCNCSLVTMSRRCRKSRKCLSNAPSRRVGEPGRVQKLWGYED
jgi:hypothetical protein